MHLYSSWRHLGAISAVLEAISVMFLVAVMVVLLVGARPRMRRCDVISRCRGFGCADVALLQGIVDSDARMWCNVQGIAASVARM